jgi:microcystin-dependent protein
MEPFIGQIEAFGFNYAPKGWALCNGALLSIAQNSALFSLLGTVYGGDGITTFALPDLRGRVAINQGSSPGGRTYAMGQMGGQEQITLITPQMPSHSHVAIVHALNGTPDSSEPGGAFLAEADVYSTGAPNTVMNAGSVTNAVAGGNQPHENMQPYLTINYCIALQGIFPSRP